MEASILLILVLFAIILYKEQPMFANAFFVIAGLFSFTGITLPTIESITGTTITYVTVDPLISWAIGFIFIAFGLIQYIELIDYGRKVQNAKDQADYSKP